MDADGVYTYSAKMDQWFKEARRVWDIYGDAFATIIFDIKTLERVDEFPDRE